MQNTIIHPRVMERHPNLTEDDVLIAWNSRFMETTRMDDDGDRLVAIGADSRGRLIEMVANRTPDGTWVVFHAMTPPSRNTIVELRLAGR